MAEAREAAMAEMLEANASLRAELQAALMRQVHRSVSSSATRVARHVGVESRDQKPRLHTGVSSSR